MLPALRLLMEIDGVGRQRRTGIGGGNEEREQTLHQLLTEMDGFEGNTGIIAIAATNRADILDSALLSPGRFDRRTGSLDVTATRTPGFCGADLANLLNESAVLVGHWGKTAIALKEIDDSFDRIVAGMEGTMMTDGKSKSLVAFMDSVYEIAPCHIRNNREAKEKIVEVLEKETMTGDEFHAILSEFVEVPAENQVPPSFPSPVFDAGANSVTVDSRASSLLPSCAAIFSPCNLKGRPEFHRSRDAGETIGDPFASVNEEVV
ncbi:hypothetical protein NL676_001925 [Syzygium grande]|nr:hypothetical protein NL676_001925 [Syzygium grande]